MHIVHVTSWLVPGLGYEENRLPAEQSELGNRVAIVTSNVLPRNLRALAYFKDGFVEHRSSNPEEGGLTVLRLASTPEVHGQILLLGLREALENTGAEVVHSHGAFSPVSLQCLLLQRRLGYRLFIDDHSHDRNFSVNTPDRAAYVKMVSAAYHVFNSSVTAFLPVTPASERVLHDYLGIPRSRMRPTYLGADHEMFHPSAVERGALRDELGLRPEDVLVITTGKFDRGKDLDVLVSAFATVVNSTPSPRLLIAGDSIGECLTEIRTLVHNLGIGDRVSFSGYIRHSDLPKFYNAADVGVWPGAHSITALEALATGLACILPEDDIAYRDILQNDACKGFLRGDAASLSEALSLMIQSRDARKRLSDRARRLVELRYSWKAIAAHSLRVYAEAEVANLH